MDWVVQIGLIELALGGLLGWAMVMRQESPDFLRRIGVVAPQRIRQIHLDYVMMGLILIGVGLAVPDLPELVAAQAAGLPVVTWQALLGELMAAEGRIGLAVTGTHGKSTTTALLGHLLEVAGLDPTVEVGAFIPAWAATVRPAKNVKATP